MNIANQIIEAITHLQGESPYRPNIEIQMTQEGYKRLLDEQGFMLVPTAFGNGEPMFFGYRIKVIK